MVDSLWDTKITVLSFPIFFRDLKIILSFRESRLLVGSSRSKSGASCRNALATPILCFSPPERVSPNSPTSVSYPFGRLSINSCRDAFFAASTISSLEAPGFAIAMLLAIESWNRHVFCGCLTGYFFNLRFFFQKG